MSLTSKCCCWYCNPPQENRMERDYIDKRRERMKRSWDKEEDKEGSYLEQRDSMKWLLIETRQINSNTCKYYINPPLSLAYYEHAHVKNIDVCTSYPSSPSLSPFSLTKIYNSLLSQAVHLVINLKANITLNQHFSVHKNWWVPRTRPLLVTLTVSVVQ